MHRERYRDRETERHRATYIQRHLDTETPTNIFIYTDRQSYIETYIQ